MSGKLAILYCSAEVSNHHQISATHPTHPTPSPYPCLRAQRPANERKFSLNFTQSIHLRLLRYFRMHIKHENYQSSWLRMDSSNNNVVHMEACGIYTGAQYACFCNLTLVLFLSYTIIGQLSSTASNNMGYSILNWNYFPIFGNILHKYLVNLCIQLPRIFIIIYLIVIMFLLKYFELSPGINLIHALPQSNQWSYSRQAPAM